MPQDHIKRKLKILHIKLWIKTWFFDIESEIEYLFSRELFFSWIKSLEGLFLSKISIDRIMWWVRTCLDPYATMWNNWRRLHVTGLDARTTSIGESMHGSMKNGTDGVRPAQSAHKSASKMMDKANQKAKKIKKYNAQELSRNRTMNHGDRGNF